jgi:hypothetical protein
MKKLALFLIVVLCVAHIVYAELNLNVYERNGEVSTFDASEVDSISFTAPKVFIVDSIAHVQSVDSVMLITL